MGFSPKDAVLTAQAQNFSTVLAAGPAVYNQTAATATAVTTAVGLYVDAWNALVEARANGVRSQQMTADKDSLRLAMLNLLRPIYSSVQDSVSISDSAKIAIGVHVRSTHNVPQPVPDFSPLMTIEKVNGNTVTVRMANPNEPSSKAKPPFVSGIALFSAVGTSAPTDPGAFKFEGNWTHIVADVTFPVSVEMGATVWFTSFFYNNRAESGPAARPISATIGAGTNLPAMKIAA